MNECTTCRGLGDNSLISKGEDNSVCFYCFGTGDSEVRGVFVIERRIYRLRGGSISCDFMPIAYERFQDALLAADRLQERWEERATPEVLMWLDVERMTHRVWPMPFGPAADLNVRTRDGELAQ